MPPKELFYKLGKKKILKFERYNNRDLIELSGEFKLNRSFDSWAKVFQKSLDRHKKDIAYKKRSKEEIARRFPRKIVKLFWDMIVDDLITQEAEVILKDSEEPKNRFILKMGYLIRVKDYLFMKRTIFTIPFAGVHYTLRFHYPQDWRNPRIVRRACFSRRQMGRVLKELKKGRRYYNSTKEKIFSRL